MLTVTVPTDVVALKLVNKVPKLPSPVLVYTVNFLLSSCVSGLASFIASASGVDLTGSSWGCFSSYYLFQR